MPHARPTEVEPRHGSEKPDPARIPNPTELASIAGQMGVAHGPKWEMFVRVAGCCALRISEAFAIRYDSFIRKDGRLWLVVSAQEHRVEASSSDDGSTRVRTGRNQLGIERHPLVWCPFPKV